MAVFMVVMGQMDIALALSLHNIIAPDTQTNAGAYASIETSGPSVTVHWAYNRIASTSRTKFVEVGWIKEDGYSEDPSARGFVTKKDRYHNQKKVPTRRLRCGGSHSDYRVLLGKRPQ